MKEFKGKAIYTPAGKAAEYARYACNFYVGCSNGCTYCYCKKGVLAGTMVGDKPTLKKCFRDEEHALEIFEKELLQNKEELQKHGLFFSFATDPMLWETKGLTFGAIRICQYHNIPVKILTKKASCSFSGALFRSYKKELLAIGFTLTGHDELEPGASTNAERIDAMRKLHDAGFKTFASIEPMINYKNGYEMISNTLGFCDLYNIGLLSGKKYNQKDLRIMVRVLAQRYKKYGDISAIYFKDSFLKQAGIPRENLISKCFVTRDYNLFNQ